MTAQALLLPTLALVLVGLSGCAPWQGTDRTPDEARDAMYEVLETTQASLGGSWQKLDDPTSRGCIIPLWVEGRQFPALRIGPAVRDADRAVGTVATLWEGLGFTISRTDVAEIAELKATRSPGELLILRAGADSMTLQGESECRPD